MSPQTRRVRYVLLATIIFGAAVIAVLRARTGNPERPALEAQIERLDARLLEARAIAEKADQYQRDLDVWRQRRDMMRRSLTPEFGALRTELSADSVDLEVLDPRPGTPRSHEVPFRLRGKTAVSLKRALEVLASSRRFLLIDSVELTQEAWTLKAIALCWNDPPWRLAARPVDTTPILGLWYSLFDRDLRREVADKTEELAALQRQLGEVGEIAWQKDQLQEAVRDVAKIGAWIESIHVAQKLFAKDCCDTLRFSAPDRPTAQVEWRVDGVVSSAVDPDELAGRLSDLEPTELKVEGREFSCRVQPPKSEAGASP